MYNVNACILEIKLSLSLSLTFLSISLSISYRFPCVIRFIQPSALLSLPASPPLPCLPCLKRWRRRRMPNKSRSSLLLLRLLFVGRPCSRRCCCHNRRVVLWLMAGCLDRSCALHTAYDLKTVALEQDVICYQLLG